MRELFGKYAKHSTGVSAWKPELSLIDEAGFIEAITDYKQSIIGLIEDMQKDKDKRYSHQEEDEKQVFWYALQELKQKIEEL